LSQATSYSAGYDITQVEKMIIMAKETVSVSTGLRLQIPETHFGIIFSRSSTHMKGVNVYNGIIDSDFNGELRIFYTNTLDECVSLHPNEKYAQIVFFPFYKINISECEKLKSKSQHYGFGSTTQHSE